MLKEEYVARSESSWGPGSFLLRTSLLPLGHFYLCLATGNCAFDKFAVDYFARHGSIKLVDLWIYV